MAPLGYHPSSNRIPFTCTLCFALVMPEHTLDHTDWHENVERVPSISHRYPEGHLVPNDMKD